MRYKFPPPSFTPHASTTTVNSYHTAMERPALRRPSPLSRSSREFPRSVSSGSVAESRLHPFSFPPERVGSSSNLSSRHNSMVSLSQTLTQRPYLSFSRPFSARSDDWRAPALQKEPLFVEMSSQSKVDINFVFPSKVETSASRVSLSSQPHSRATSIHSFHSNIDRPVIIRSASVIQSSHLDQTHRKIPLFVPARIEKHSSMIDDEPPTLSGRRDSGMGPTEGAGDENDMLRPKKSELSNWSMTYQEGAIDRVSLDIVSDSATIRPSKRGSLKDIINHISSKTSRSRGDKNTPENDDAQPRHANFAKGCGSCVRRLSRAFRNKQLDSIISSSTEKLRP